jgi:hypothetical protein
MPSREIAATPYFSIEKKTNLFTKVETQLAVQFVTTVKYLFP